jgi:hypothetical protein
MKYIVCACAIGCAAAFFSLALAVSEVTNAGYAISSARVASTAVER